MYERVLAEISKAVVAWHGQECMAGRLYDKCCLHSMGGRVCQTIWTPVKKRRYIHTWYLWILVHHHTIEACKKYTTAGCGKYQLRQQVVAFWPVTHECLFLLSGGSRGLCRCPMSFLPDQPSVFPRSGPRAIVPKITQKRRSIFPFCSNIHLTSSWHCKPVGVYHVPLKLCCRI